MEREIKHVDIDKPKEENKPLNENIKEVKKVESAIDDKASFIKGEAEMIDDAIQNQEGEEQEETDTEVNIDEEEIVTLDNAEVGKLVKRGPDWNWGDQDKFNGGCGIGRIVSIQYDDQNVLVKWLDHDLKKQTHVNFYRVGKQGVDFSKKIMREFYDLYYHND